MPSSLKKVAVRPDDEKRCFASPALRAPFSEKRAGAFDYFVKRVLIPYPSTSNVINIFNTHLPYFF